MNAQSKVYANSGSTVFYDANAQIITEIHQPKEWNPHNLNQYGKGALLGVSTGKTLNSNNGILIEIIHSYDHQFRVLAVSKWRPRTVILYVREDQITTDAPPTEEEKETTKTAEKAAQTQKLIESLGLGATDPTVTSNSSASSTVIAIIVGVVILVFVLLWAFLSGRKGKKAATPPVIILPEEKGKIGKATSNQNVSLITTN